MNNPASNQGPEGRKFPRLTTDIDVVYSRVGAESCEALNSIKNISAGGICLIAYEDIPIGAVLKIKLSLPETNGPIEVKGKVMWKSKFSIENLSEPRYDVGVQFIDIPQEYQDIIAKHAFSSPRRINPTKST